MTKPLKEKLSWGLKIQIFVLTLAICLVIFMLLGPWPALKSSPLYFVFLGIAEVIHWMQMRQNVRCEVCDFDPILYRENWKKARAQVESKMQKAYNRSAHQIREAIDFASLPMKSAEEASRLPPATSGDKSLPAATAAAKTLSSLKNPGKDPPPKA